MNKSADFVPDIRVDKKPTLIRTPVNNHDILQLRLAKVLRNRSLDVMRWLAKHNADVQKRLALLPAMISLSGSIDAVIANFDIEAFEAKVTNNSDISQAIDFAWNKHSLRALKKKAARLRTYGVDFAIEVPLTETISSAEPALSALLPPTGYLDIVVDIDTPFLRFIYLGSRFRADIVSLASGVGDSPFVTTSEHFLWPTSWLLALDNVYLPMGQIVRSGTPDGDTLLAKAADILNKDKWIRAMREDLQKLLDLRSLFAGYHQYLALELKTGSPSVEMLWAQVGKYDQIVCGSHHLSAEPLSGEKSAYYDAAYQKRSQGNSIRHTRLTKAAVGRIWRFGPLIGYDGRRAPQPYTVKSHGAALWTTHAVVFPGDYPHKDAASDLGISIILHADSMLNPSAHRTQ